MHCFHTHKTSAKKTKCESSKKISTKRRENDGDSTTPCMYVQVSKTSYAKRENLSEGRLTPWTLLVRVVEWRVLCSYLPHPLPSK